MAARGDRGSTAFNRPLNCPVPKPVTGRRPRLFLVRRRPADNAEPLRQPSHRRFVGDRIERGSNRFHRRATASRVTSTSLVPVSITTAGSRMPAPCQFVCSTRKRSSNSRSAE